MKNRIITNALIDSTMLGVEGHGIMTWYLQLKFPPGGQGFGGFALDTWNDKQNSRIGSAWGMESVLRILKVVGVEKWEDLPGKYVRIDHEDWGKIYRIGNIVEDKWFEPESDLAFLAAAKEAA